MTMTLSLLLASLFTFVELNCENLFDCRHDSLKQDTEFMPDGQRHWTATRYWGKLNRIGQELLSCSEELPDVVALCEVENDTVMRDLTRRSLLRNAGYEYLMSESDDVRGIDVALLYQPATFRPICYETFSVPTVKGMRPTRDLLYVKGETRTGDTLHIVVVHAPSRYGGERRTRPYRMLVARRVTQVCDSIRDRSAQALVLVAGDFNDPATSPALRHVTGNCGLQLITDGVKGRHGTPGNYRHDGEWQQLDHVLLSPSLHSHLQEAYINDEPFLLEEDKRYGGQKPRRTFVGYRHQKGFSDHLPVVVQFHF